jgi:LPS-assembly protein
MRTPVWGGLFIFLAAGLAIAARSTSDHEPVEITSSGETTYGNGIATARDNVAIHIGDTDIYGDFAQYNSQTHEVLVRGNVRIYRDVSLYIADEGVYNIDTKQIRTSNVRTEYHPYFLGGQNVNERSANVYHVEDANFTTDDSSRPDFHLHARTVRVYENDHVVFQNVTFYIGRLPVFWWPYMYQSLNDAFSFSIAPADLSSWGPSLLTQITFPITDDIKGKLRLDYRGRRGPAIGFDSDIDYGKD